MTLTPTELVRRREALGLSQAEVAELAGLTGEWRMTVSSWETGKRNISNANGRLLEMELVRLEAMTPNQLDRERERLRETGGLSAHRGRQNAGVR